MKQKSTQLCESHSNHLIEKILKEKIIKKQTNKLKTRMQAYICNKNSVHRQIKHESHPNS